MDWTIVLVCLEGMVMAIGFTVWTYRDACSFVAHEYGTSWEKFESGGEVIEEALIGSALAGMGITLIWLAAYREIDGWARLRVFMVAMAIVALTCFTVAHLSAYRRAARVKPEPARDDDGLYWQ